jgi:hypothetical protein
MRRLASESPVIAAAGGSIGTISFQRSNGQTIPPLSTAASRSSSRPSANSAEVMGVGSLPASFGAVGEALSTSATKTAFGPHSFTTSTGGLVSKPSERSTGHSHFGQECFGPQPGDPTTTNAPPLHSMLTKENVQKNNRGSTAAGRRNSFSSVATDDDKSLISNSQMLHKCEACSKVYRHPSCLVKHRWEHTVYWKEASKFLMSKHQQVQLLEAAAILVGMDTDARSLPEEKALWPAAVSPPSSGLLGSDKINFEKLLAQKSARKSHSPEVQRRETPRTTNASRDFTSPSSVASSLPLQAASLSPLQSFTTLNLGKYTRNGDIGHLRLDESAERNVREESVDSEDEEDDEEEEDEGDESMTGSTTISTGSPSREAEERERERYGLGAGGDVLAEMEMEGVE